MPHSDEVLAFTISKNQSQVLSFRDPFIGPHRALKFGKLMKPPAMQAGLVSRKMTFRDIFTWPLTGSLFGLVLIDCRGISGRMGPVGKTA